MRRFRGLVIVVIAAWSACAAGQSGITTTLSSSSGESVEFTPACSPLGSVRTIETVTLEEVVGPACVLIGNRDNVPPTASCPTSPVPASLPTDGAIGRYFFVALGTINIDSNHHTQSIHCLASGTTFSTTHAAQSGAINAEYTWTTNAIGPADIVTGALGNCVLTGSPPFAGCTLSLGTGTVDDPFKYLCDAPLGLTGCIGGTPVHVLNGTQNVNAHTQTIIAIGTTATSTYSTQAGTANARYVWFSETIGPANVTVGMLDGCTLIGSPPFAGCSLSGGSGTIADPFEFSCTSPLPLAGCTGGSTFPVASNTSNLDFHTHAVVASAVATPVAAVPLDPWVPIAGASAVLLAFVLLRRRLETRRRQC